MGELKTLGELDDAPEKAPVGSVVGEGAVLIGADERTGQVAEELVVVVEFAPGSRADVAADHCGVFEGLPAEHKEEFAVALTAGIVETELGGSARSWDGLTKNSRNPLRSSRAVLNSCRGSPTLLLGPLSTPQGLHLRLLRRLCRRVGASSQLSLRHLHCQLQ